MTAALTHIAAQPIQFDRRLRQRCAWCGAVLHDYDLDRVAVAVQPGEQAEPPGMWEVGALVRITEGNPRISGVVEPERDGDDWKLPDDGCARLDDGVTA